ncbi:hypothetical protein PCANC_22252 [Puccinia coronata f. sp. avenae]|uniref:Cyanate hydratase n=1 Tax=Puccinia coronata f. sp. avenae TaxID=200324 RepID=A0A2N5SF63_9BASI|nr:hypothetical protein PCANC_22252 [Puccinia coronata f. sp. avenae]
MVNREDGQQSRWLHHASSAKWSYKDDVIGYFHSNAIRPQHISSFRLIPTILLIAGKGPSCPERFIHCHVLSCFRSYQEHLMMAIWSSSRWAGSAIPRIASRVSSPSMLSACISFPGLSHRYYGAPITPHPTNELLKRLVEAKETKELSFSEIAKRIGRSEVWTAALFYGQAKPEEKDLEKLSEVLGIPEKEFAKGFPKSFFPIRGTGVQIPPSDPLMYRLYEFLIVYGFPLKSIIHEKFGDGIMSAIDFTCEVKKVEQDKAERVVITLNGKWLPYKRW